MNASSVMFVISAVLAVFILYLNVAATVWLSKTDKLNHFQKWSKGVITWLLPYVGARFVLSFLRETDPEALPRSMLGYRAFDWLKTADTRIDTWAGSNSRTTRHPDSGDHDSGPGNHDC